MRRKRRGKVRKLSHLRWYASVSWATMNILIEKGRGANGLASVHGEGADEFGGCVNGAASNSEIQEWN